MSEEGWITFKLIPPSQRLRDLFRPPREMVPHRPACPESSYGRRRQIGMPVQQLSFQLLDNEAQLMAMILDRMIPEPISNAGEESNVHLFKLPVIPGEI